MKQSPYLILGFEEIRKGSRNPEQTALPLPEHPEIPVTPVPKPHHWGTGRHQETFPPSVPDAKLRLLSGGGAREDPALQELHFMVNYRATDGRERDRVPGLGFLLDPRPAGSEPRLPAGVSCVPTVFLVFTSTR